MCAYLLNSFLNTLFCLFSCFFAVSINKNALSCFRYDSNKRITLDTLLSYKRDWRIAHADIKNIKPINMIANNNWAIDLFISKLLFDIAH
jgi:hypothetical protein